MALLGSDFGDDGGVGDHAMVEEEGGEDVRGEERGRSRPKRGGRRFH